VFLDLDPVSPIPAGSSTSPPSAALPAPPTPALPRAASAFPKSSRATLPAPPTPHSHVRPRRSLSHLARPCLRRSPPHSHVRPRRPLCRLARPDRLPHSPVRHRRLPLHHTPLRRLATPTPSKHTSAMVDAVPRLVLAPRPRPITPSSSTAILDTSTLWSPATRAARVSL
jgi:hypothetical protein